MIAITGSVAIGSGPASAQGHTSYGCYNWIAVGPHRGDVKADLTKGSIAATETFGRPSSQSGCTSHNWYHVESGHFHFKWNQVQQEWQHCGTAWSGLRVGWADTYSACGPTHGNRTYNNHRNWISGQHDDLSFVVLEV